MFNFPWRRTSRRTEQERPDPGTPMLVLEPARIVLAIGYHLLEEGIAAAVDADSRDSAVRALAGLGMRLTVEKARWAAMRNSDRLHWLLAHASTTLALDADRTAVLRVSTRHMQKFMSHGWKGSDLPLYAERSSLAAPGGQER